MYKEFFNLKEKPFSLNPDPQFLYLSKNHIRAQTMLEYGFHSQAGFTVITGDIGAGKTTLVNYLLEQEGYSAGLIQNPTRATASRHVALFVGQNRAFLFHRNPDASVLKRPVRSSPL